MNLDSFSTVIDDRRYMKPEVYVDESNAFIENLRNTQGQRNEQIAQDTYNLGTAVPSNLGGLGGSSAYFNARYQTPYTNAVVADLRATAQAQALNEAMNNTLAQAKEKYNKAYKSYQRRVAARNATLGGTGGTDGTGGTGGANGAGGKLPIDTNSKQKSPDTTTLPGGGSDIVTESTWAGFPYTGNTYKWKVGNLEWLYDGGSPLSSHAPVASPMTVGKDGTMKNIGGKTYIAMNGQWYPVIKKPF